MLRRILKPLNSNSFFLFGARGTGKSTLIGELVKASSSHLIDLLDPRVYDEYLANSGLLLERFGLLQKRPEWIVLDEVQRLPSLLNEVHKLIFEHKQKFILTGSSARKLKRGGANLLAGRAFTYNLYPLTHLELGESFNLDETLQWGALPQVAVDKRSNERREYLNAYVSTYMKEEIIAEQVVRKIEGFRRFLKVAAQANGTIVVFDKIAKDVGIDPTTVKSYFGYLPITAQYENNNDKLLSFIFSIVVCSEQSLVSLIIQLLLQPMVTEKPLNILLF
jgi:predicted AAA+ superfamily ATPase